MLKKDTSGWTRSSYLPGGNIERGDFEGFIRTVRGHYPWLPVRLSRHYARNYGTRAFELLSEANSLEDLGLCFGDGLYEAEVRYLVRTEWARTAADILWRRTKWGLRLSRIQGDHLVTWLTEHLSCH